jgi:MFS family permease
MAAIPQAPDDRPAAAPALGGGWPDERVAWYACFVLMLTLLVNFLDRGIVALLVPYIKADLSLSDSQIGLIMGFAFVMFYLIAGLPIARYADHGNRKILVAIGMALWGGATALCGLATSFFSLFAFRVGVGVGEACTGPASFSLLGDYFRPHRLPRAIAFLNFGFILGNGLAVLIGGTLVYLLATATSIDFPLFGTLRVWQAAFLICGAPGLIVGLVMLTVPEPPRRVQGATPPVAAVARFVIDHKGVYVPLIVGISLNTIVFIAQQSWGPTFFMRTYGWSIGQIGLVTGLTFLTVLPPGAILGGIWAQRMAQRGRHDANLRVSLYALAMAWPFLLAAPLMPSGWLAAGSGAIGLFCTSLLFGPQNAAIQAATPNRMRGQVTALVLFGFNVIGVGLGPSILAFLTDYVFRDESQIRYALATCYAVISPIAFLILWSGLKPYGRRIAQLEEEEHAKSIG